MLCIRVRSCAACRYRPFGLRLIRRNAVRRISLSPNGRSGALLIGSRDPAGGFALTVTASVRRPVRLVFAGLPERAEVVAALENAIPDALYHDDVHGRPDWRRHITRHLAGEIRDALAEDTDRCG
jgi:hypothetical protein